MRAKLPELGLLMSRFYQVQVLSEVDGSAVADDDKKLEELIRLINSKEDYNKTSGRGSDCQ